jgi:hypothetical protein
MRIKMPSASEIRAHRIVRRVLAETGWTIGANVSVQQVFEKEERLSSAEFSLYTRGSFDFLVRDDEFMPVFALEVDGFGHGQPRQIARDLIKNDLCYRAGLPLLRVRAEHLAEAEETSVLEWLLDAFVKAEIDPSAEPDGEDLEPEDADEDPADEPVDEDAEEAADDFVLGEPGIEIDHPFPDNALLERRLRERHAIGIGQVGGEFVVLPDGARYLLDLAGWGAMKERTGQVAAFVTSERAFKVCASTDQRPLFEGIGRSQFAWANRLPDGRTTDGMAPIEFGWDAYGVANELAEFDALRKCERWAEAALSGGASRDHG